MKSDPVRHMDNKWVVSERGAKNKVDPYVPYHWLVEEEHMLSGEIEEVGTVFLSNKECSFKCLMCDLWKNTTDRPVPEGAIPRQMELAMDQMKGVKHLKLYNSGSFFDQKAIPPADYPEIAKRVAEMETLIVESHPSLIGEKVLDFRDTIAPELVVAIGLETVHPQVLEKLNKQMSVADFNRAVRFLSRHGIRSRAFILLRPPFMNEQEGVFWAKRSLEVAFEAGVECCVVIPVRGGNGALETLAAEGQFSPPLLSSLEEVLDHGISLQRGRVFADLWDLELLSSCPNCFASRKDRLEQVNLYQQLLEPVTCSCSESK